MKGYKTGGSEEIKSVQDFLEKASYEHSNFVKYLWVASVDKYYAYVVQL